MGKEFSNFQEENIMRVNLRMIKKKVTVNFIGVENMEKFIKVNGKITFKMVKV